MKPSNSAFEILSKTNIGEGLPTTNAKEPEVVSKIIEKVDRPNTFR
jgi:hypothetical protein